MTIVTKERLLRVLENAPSIGMTTIEVAAELGERVVNISARLSKLALYGEIDREFVKGRTGQGGPQKWSVYRSKAKEAASA